METAQDFSHGVMNNVGDVIVGKAEVIEHLLIALLCEGHVLLEDVPRRRQDDDGEGALC